MSASSSARIRSSPVAVHGRPNLGYCYVHSAIDSRSRLAYSEALDDETAATAIGFLDRAGAFFAGHGIGRIERVLTDNGPAYVSHAWRHHLAAAGIRHTRTRPRRPQTNGKVERFNRTLLEEWAYTRLYTSEKARRAALPAFLHTYNHHRRHTALGGPPISRAPTSPSSTASRGRVPRRR
jgi:transposase InsO family protein